MLSTTTQEHNMIYTPSTFTVEPHAHDQVDYRFEYDNTAARAQSVEAFVAQWVEISDLDGEPVIAADIVADYTDHVLGASYHGREKADFIAFATNAIEALTGQTV